MGNKARTASMLLPSNGVKKHPYNSDQLKK